MKIKLLDDSLINKIAAGEVIERPASIVKELIENSIDAGSKRINVEIVNGGIDRIEVEDDGEGISAQEIPLAFLRHATSKIEARKDLFAISTLGFRGEALPSIASVSKMEVYTRQAEEGVFAVIEGGQIIATQPSLSPKGTRIVVKELFYNTPVRKEFLKTMVTEGRNVHEIVCKYSISRPDISFTFSNDKQTFFKTPGNGKLIEVLAAIYGHDFISSLVEVTHQGEKHALTGYISTPDVNRRSRRNQVYFINNRPIRSPLLYRAVDNAYKGLLLRREYPIVFLNISLPRDLVDVNIHPQKSEVRFKDEKEIFRVAYGVLKNRLDELDYRVTNRPSYLQPIVDYPSIDNHLKKSGSIYEQPLIGLEPAKTLCHLMDPEFLDNQKTSATIDDGKGDEVEYSIIGQCLDSYILLEMDGKLLIIDQHAAHERVIYNRLQKVYSTSQEIGQTLVLPVTIELGYEEIELLEKHHQLCTELGFELESWGFNTIAIRTAPAVIAGNEAEVINELLEVLRLEEKFDLKKEAMIIIACKKAVKANEKLSSVEMINIIRQLFAAEDYKHCPHGRPTIINFSHDDLDRLFKR